MIRGGLQIGQRPSFIILSDLSPRRSLVWGGFKFAVAFKIDFWVLPTRIHKILRPSLFRLFAASNSQKSALHISTCFMMNFSVTAGCRQKPCWARPCCAATTTASKPVRHRENFLTRCVDITTELLLHPRDEKVCANAKKLRDDHFVSSLRRRNLFDDRRAKFSNHDACPLATSFYQVKTTEVMLDHSVSQLYLGCERSGRTLLGNQPCLPSASFLKFRKRYQL